MNLFNLSKLKAKKADDRETVIKTQPKFSDKIQCEDERIIQKVISWYSLERFEAVLEKLEFSFPLKLYMKKENDQEKEQLISEDATGKICALTLINSTILVGGPHVPQILINDNQKEFGYSITREKVILHKVSYTKSPLSINVWLADGIDDYYEGAGYSIWNEDILFGISISSAQARERNILLEEKLLNLDLNSVSFKEVYNLTKQYYPEVQIGIKKRLSEEKCVVKYNNNECYYYAYEFSKEFYRFCKDGSWRYENDKISAEAKLSKKGFYDVEYHFNAADFTEETARQEVKKKLEEINKFMDSLS